MTDEQDLKAASAYAETHSVFKRELHGNIVSDFLAGAEHGRKAELAEWQAHFKQYREAYAEDLFTPIASGEKNDGSDRFTTRVSGQMGRFILDNLIRKASAPTEPSRDGEGEK